MNTLNTAFSTLKFEETASNDCGTVPAVCAVCVCAHFFSSPFSNFAECGLWAGGDVHMT